MWSTFAVTMSRGPSPAGTLWSARMSVSSVAESVVMSRPKGPGVGTMTGNARMGTVTSQLPLLRWHEATVGVNAGDKYCITKSEQSYLYS